MTQLQRNTRSFSADSRYNFIIHGKISSSSSFECNWPFPAVLNEQKKARDNVNIPNLMFFGKFMFFRSNTKISKNEFGVFSPQFLKFPSTWRIDSYFWNYLDPTHLRKTRDALIMWCWDLVSREVRSYSEYNGASRQSGAYCDWSTSKYWEIVPEI